MYSILYSIYSILSSKLTFKSWILTSEKKDQVARIGVRGGGGLGDSGNARKKTFFFIDVFPNVLLWIELKIDLSDDDIRYSSDKPPIFSDLGHKKGRKRLLECNSLWFKRENSANIPVQFAYIPTHPPSPLFATFNITSNHLSWRCFSSLDEIEPLWCEHERLHCKMKGTKIWPKADRQSSNTCTKKKWKKVHLL